MINSIRLKIFENRPAACISGKSFQHFPEADRT